MNRKTFSCLLTTALGGIGYEGKIELKSNRLDIH